MQTDRRVTDSYRYLDHVGPEAFAWEFLRRNASYQAAYKSISNEKDAILIAQHWGCATDPDLPADRAQIMWAGPTFRE